MNLFHATYFGRVFGGWNREGKLTEFEAPLIQRQYRTFKVIKAMEISIIDQNVNIGSY